MRAVSGLIGINLVLRSCKSLNEHRVIDTYFMDKFFSASPVNLPCIIINCIRDTVNTNMKHRTFSFSLLLTNIFWHFEVHFSSEEQVITTSSDIINGETISRSGFEYNKIERRWIARSGLSRRENFGHQRTKPTRYSGKAVEEEEDDEDEGEDTEGRDKEYDESESSICTTLEQM
ncbi:hypothetical protein M9H77_26104 [Catharanthus roseus]|uniref:Uncharacterized protein n=1 Tax=Catharanthus roseus TaxID=4058 RepID=A0ACC0A967_CATRO|nr:hypothetical protein M9H77_26104 [Catharanthus roseus]